MVRKWSEMVRKWSEMVRNGPKMVRKWSEKMVWPWSENGLTMVRKWSDHGPKMVWPWSEMVRIWSELVPCRVRMVWKWSENGLTMVRNGPKMVWSGVSMVLKWSEYGPKMVCSRVSMVLKWSEYGPKMVRSRVTMVLKWSEKWSWLGLAWSQNGTNMAMQVDMVRHVRGQALDMLIERFWTCTAWPDMHASTNWRGTGSSKDDTPTQKHHAIESNPPNRVSVIDLD